jgi:hypothetical protein
MVSSMSAWRSGVVMGTVLVAGAATAAPGGQLGGVGTQSRAAPSMVTSSAGVIAYWSGHCKELYPMSRKGGAPDVVDQACTQGTGASCLRSWRMRLGCPAITQSRLLTLSRYPHPMPGSRWCAPASVANRLRLHGAQMAAASGPY